MKMLVISPYIPGLRAASMRLYQLLKNIGDHKITILLFIDKKEPLSIEVEKVWDRMLVNRFSHKKKNILLARSLFSTLPYPAHLYSTPKVYKPVYGLLSKEFFDVILIMSPYLAACLNLDYLKNRCSVLGLDINESDAVLWETYSRNGSLPQRLFAQLQIAKTKRVEQRIFNRMDCVFFVSEEEQQLAKRSKASIQKLWVVPNGVDPEAFKPRKVKPDKNTLLFLGALNVKRNSTALHWFVKNVFPLIKKEIPDVQLNIVGARADQSIKDLGKREGINFVGEVKDVSKAYSENAVLVSPHRLGGGTRLKVLECLSMQVPIITSSAGIRGIDVRGVPSVFVADTASDFARKTVHVLQNYERIKKQTIQGRKRVQERYSWKRISETLGKRLEDLRERNTSS